MGVTAEMRFSTCRPWTGASKAPRGPRRQDELLSSCGLSFRWCGSARSVSSEPPEHVKRARTLSRHFTLLNSTGFVKARRGLPEAGPRSGATASTKGGQ
eukprot:1335509-Prymnesium_polylepis.2